ncbi:MAG: glutamate formiminotransferase / 5-formyltetrahydrofolate cyclo-ligase [Solirubrobacteraceae bacterium]|jgi:glutamate formiminotransferase/glutamate formiminotransferase/formiminotetrahydrofolate cyclodeaminase|nr:glutamate formiminotransferase / 5-formyltetrahydrofolate cyclo-ligase [Solirubrobacteraceae bacterium]
MPEPTLLAVPNISEGRDERTIAAVRHAIESKRVRLLDAHRDPDHHRSVFTVAGPPRSLCDAVLAGARVAVECIDVMSRTERDPIEAGQHPHVGAIDVAPIVYLEESARGAACAEALVLADRIGEELGVPVFLYGELTAGPDRQETSRSQLRRGGAIGLAQRIDAGAAPSGAPAGDRPELRPDFGPARIHPSAGATLVAARPPLVAFNLELASPADLKDARRIAATIREGGSEGLPGVRAIAIRLSDGTAQVSMNVERPFEVSLAEVLEAVVRHAPVACAELVGLAPRAALRGFPADVEILGFDPARHVIENALGS